MIPVIFPKVPQSSLGILQVPYQGTPRPPLGHRALQSKVQKKEPMAEKSNSFTNHSAKLLRSCGVCRKQNLREGSCHAKRKFCITLRIRTGNPRVVLRDLIPFLRISQDSPGFSGPYFFKGHTHFLVWNDESILIMTKNGRNLMNQHGKGLPRIVVSTKKKHDN